MHCPYSLEKVTIGVLHGVTHSKGFHFKYVHTRKALKPIDSSNFLWALTHKISDIHNVPFDVNSWQDAVEVLQVVLDDPKVTSVLANDLVSNALRTTTTCNTCLCSAAKEEKCDILPRPMSSNVKTSLDKLLDSETLSSQNKWFCPSCDTLTESTRETSITKYSSVLIIQFTQFSILDSSNKIRTIF